MGNSKSNNVLGGLESEKLTLHGAHHHPVVEHRSKDMAPALHIHASCMAAADDQGQSKENKLKESQACNAKAVWEKYSNLEPPAR
jgi:hypothetical protein